METILKLFENNMFFIATMDKDQPRVRPFGKLLGYGGSLYINTGNTKEVYRQIKENPKVELCVFSKGKIIRLTAQAIESDNPEVRKVMLNQEPGIANMYKGKEDTLSMFQLTHVVTVVTQRGKETARITLDQEGKSEKM